MRIAILGAGFTGLSAALELLKEKHEVVIFEKESQLGGLAIGFKKNNWDWTLEKGYHHWFTNDDAILNIAKVINQKVYITRPKTDIFAQGQIKSFDNALSVLKFPYLSFISRIRLGLAVLYLKLINNYTIFEGQKALPWIKKWMGKKVADTIWIPLLKGKFGDLKNEISLIWFWARIKKRTPSLAYPAGGFQSFANRLGSKIRKSGGKILLNTSVLEIKSLKNGCFIKTDKNKYPFDKIICTLPSPIFTKVAKGLSKKYIKKTTSIKHLHTQVLILILKKAFMEKSYWLNITDRKYPFLVLAEHTNFMDPKYYGNQHILYIGNYLDSKHPFLKMSKKDLLKEFDPFLKKINPDYRLDLIDSSLFVASFAQPVVTPDYTKFIPTFITPLPNIYLANMDMVYPWDRGTNYAVEMGQKIAKTINTL